MQRAGPNESDGRGCKVASERSKDRSLWDDYQCRPLLPQCVQYKEHSKATEKPPRIATGV